MSCPDQKPKARYLNQQRRFFASTVAGTKKTCKVRLFLAEKERAKHSCSRVGKRGGFSYTLDSSFTGSADERLPMTFAELAPAVLFAAFAVAYGTALEGSGRLHFWVVYPSLVLHRLAHFLVALCLLAGPSWAILPQRQPPYGSPGAFDDIAMKRPWGWCRPLVALAPPLLLLPAAYLLFHHWSAWLPLHPGVGSTLLAYGSAMVLLTAAAPTPEDLREATRSPGWSLAWAASLALAWFTRDGWTHLWRVFRPVARALLQRFVA